MASSSDTPSNTSSTTTTSSSSPETAVAQRSRDISGNYTISGENEGGQGEYTGDLTITKRGDVYQFSWSSGDKTYDGVGVQTGNSVGVAFTEGSEGTGCGVVLYEIKPDGNLDGKAGYWGVDEAETEKATRTSGSDLEGTYNVSGENPEGKAYNGKLSVKKEGAGYRFAYDTGSTMTGFGIRGANMVAVGLGGSNCGFLGYDIQSDGTLEGKWGSPGSTSVGTEVAKKK